jgi:polyisoprenoid-binding protein YceI
VFAAAALLGGAVACGPVAAEPYRFVIDPDHWSMAFSATHLGYENVIGLFLKGEGSFVYDEATRQLSDLKIIVPAASVFTHHQARDDHLRSDAFLDATAHPEVTFVMTGAQATGEKTGKITGDLTLRGVTHPVTVDVTLNKIAKYPYNDNYVIGISARTVVKRSLWGSTYAVDNGWVADEIPITIELEAIRQAGGKQ